MSSKTQEFLFERKITIAPLEKNAGNIYGYIDIGFVLVTSNKQSAIDVFDKAVSVKTDDPKLQNYLIGFTMVNTQLGQILENYGVKKIKAMGEKFDPIYHSAIETIATDECEPGIVIEEIMTGYTYKDRILRPSMVKVSAQKENN